MRASPVILSGLLLIAGGALVATAQEPPSGPGAALSSLALLDLHGDLVSVRYSAGALQRAAQIQDPFELLARDFGKWSGRPERLSVLLLSRDEWEGAGLSQPYGLPVRAHGSNVVSAAWGDAGTVDLWGRLLGWNLPTVEDAPARNTGDEAGSLVAADLLGLFEGARLLAGKARYGADEGWISEVVAHTVAATVIARGAAGGVARAAEIYRSLAETRRDRPLPLSAYRSGLPIEDWLWFQAQFFEAARRILDSEKRGAGKSIVKLARQSNGRLSSRDLFDRYPALRPWLADSFAPAVP